MQIKQMKMTDECEWCMKKKTINSKCRNIVLRMSIRNNYHADNFRLNCMRFFRWLPYIVRSTKSETIALSKMNFDKRRNNTYEM